MFFSTKGPYVLYLDLIRSLAIVITIGFAIGQTPLAKDLFSLERSLKKQFLLGIFFGCVAILGTALGTPVNGAIANLRDVGAIGGGLFGGPLVGLIAGVIGGVERFYFGGFTAIPCALATIINGLIAGLLYEWKRGELFGVLPGILFTSIAETGHMLLVIALSRPFSNAVNLIKIIGGPMILANSIGVGLFLLVIQVTLREREKISALTAEKVLKIANETLPILSKGLTEESANKTAKIIMKYTNLDAVALTDRETILAFVGKGADHHKPGIEIQTKSTKLAIRMGKDLLLKDRKAIACSNPQCPLGSGVIVPLRNSIGNVLGALKLYRVDEYAITPLDFELARGMANILINQIELREIEREREMRILSQFKELQARINPHFLFNALNTIGYIIRRNPEKARDLLYKLSFILREVTDRKDNLIELREEFELIKSYLTIEKERFREKLKIEWNIASETLDVKIPPLIIQPIVENSVKHGFSPSTKELVIKISSLIKSGRVFVTVEDNGRGISSDKIDEVLNHSPNNMYCVGLRNVLDRMKNLYDKNHYFKIKDKKDKRGTKITIGFPIKGGKKWSLERLLSMTNSLQERN